MHVLLLPLFAAYACAPADPAPQAKGSNKLTPPPGMVMIAGGPTKIGSTADQVIELGRQNEFIFQNVAFETPQHEARVDDFYLGVTEVTNEQFAAFVTATGRRAPEHWAEQILDEAQRDFLNKEGEAKKLAKDEGRPYEARKFDRAQWWRQNGQGKPWKIPPGKEAHPVVYVEYADAKEYARWAGVRLMTEFEFQRAGRGKTDNLYPWGPNPDSKRCANADLQLQDTQPVGSYPDGAINGVYDLSGNVFEWTASPFVAYPKFKVLTIEVGAGKQARKIEALPGWDANQRVVVSGSYQSSMLVARLTTRRPTERDQATDSLGFRCAASTTPGIDIAQMVLSDDVPAEKRPMESSFDVSRVLAADHWTSTPGTSKVADYSVITGFGFVLYIPAVDIDATSVKAVVARSVEQGFLPLGVLSTTVPVEVPSLAPGSYVVALRGASKAPVEAGAKQPSDKPKDKQKTGVAGQEDEQKPAEEPAAVAIRVPEGFDYGVDALIFYTPDGEPAAWMPAPDLEYARPETPSMTIGDDKRKVTTTDADGKPQIVEEPVVTMSMKLNSLVKVSNKGFGYSLRLMFKPGTMSNEWRHP